MADGETRLGPTPAVACRLCGRPLFGRAWSAEMEGESHDYCDPDCEALFHEYWLPRYGAGTGKG